MCVLTLAGGFTDLVASKPKAGSTDNGTFGNKSSTATLSETTTKQSNSQSNAAVPNANSKAANSNKAQTTSTKPRRF
jgi:hypothetical protein